MFEVFNVLATGAELAIIAIAAAGTATAVVGQVQAGRAAEKRGKFQAEIAARNAEQAIKDAEGRREAASAAAVQKEREGRELKARQAAGFAKSGVELRGSPLSVLVQTAQDTAADAATIRREGAILAATDEFRAGTITAQGTAAKARGKATQRASVLSAVGTGVSGVGSIGQSRLNRGLKPFSPGKI